MPVLLRASKDLPPDGSYQAWTSIEPTARALPVSRIEGEAAALEAAFKSTAPEWFELARRMAGASDAWLAHTPVCAANASDFGLMLAWTHLIDRWAGEAPTVLILCDDPWLFRHLASRPGVSAGRAPGLWRRGTALRCRGYLARLAVAMRVARAALALRPGRRKVTRHRPAILVYGHPASTPEGYDAYFGPLMTELPQLVRILHVDAMPSRVGRLAGPEGRTLSLHSFGNPLFAVTLPFRRWRPKAEFTAGPVRWLVRRSAEKEGGSGQAAMIAWQRHCQRRWLRAAQPSVVAWPWESHAWERDFVPLARAAGARTVGYQHSVVGMQTNFSAASLPSERHLPDVVACNGMSTFRQLQAYGIPADRLRLGGALRFARNAPARFDPQAPVFVAVPFDGRVAAQMVAALRPLGAAGSAFLVKDHPLTPFNFAESVGVQRTEVPLERQPGVSAVAFAATTVGLEAILAGIPTLRFRPRGCIALDILPEDCDVQVTDAETLGRDLGAARRPRPLDKTEIFGPVDFEFWKGMLA